jgi:hypothetical protein
VLVNPSPHLLMKKVEKPFTKEDTVLDLSVMNAKFSLVFGVANHDPLTQSIFHFLTITLLEKS